MIKAELIEKMASGAAISKKEAALALESLMRSVCQCVGSKNGRIALRGFGIFTRQHAQARKGRNPRTGEAVQIQARNRVRFRPGKQLRD